MKKITAIAALLIIAMTSSAQDWSGKIYKFGTIYPGYYVGEKGDTVRGYFMHNNQVQNQSKCEYYKNETDRKPTQVFGPEDISSYMVADKLYRSIHYSGGLLAKPLKFNLVTKDGGITTFLFYNEMYEREADGSIKNTVVYFKANDAANPKPLSMQDFGIGFAKKMAAYVADDTALSTKVADKEKGYGMLQIDKIIEEYNAWYKTK
ncbi:hypothetical protein BH11BAC7_BH11BAC7_26190 [soil metagenome]